MRAGGKAVRREGCFCFFGGWGIGCCGVNRVRNLGRRGCGHCNGGVAMKVFVILILAAVVLALAPRSDWP